MIFKKRNSSSAEYPKLLEYLQAGILIRFNITETTSEEEITSYLYEEFWFSLDSSREFISNTVGEYGFELTKEYVL